LSAESSQNLLELEGVTKAYGGIVAVDDLSLSVEEGSITSLIGPNGAGKTTAFDLISGIVPMDAGTVHFAGNDISGKRPYAIAKQGIGRTFQVTRELGEMTVMENLAVGSTPNSPKSLFGGRVSSEEYEAAMDVLEFLGIDSLVNAPAGSLSYGQRKLLEIAAALVTEPRMIMLDEPAGGVNPALLDRIADRIKAVNGRGVTFLIVEHNMDFVMRLSDSVAVMAHGALLLKGTPREVQNDDRVLEAYLGGM